MKQKTNVLQGRPWLVALLMLLSWLLPQAAAADRYVERTYQYQVMLNGTNTIRIKAPVYDEKWDDHWVNDGKLKARWTDDSGTKHDELVLFWRWNGTEEGEWSHDNDDKTLKAEFKTEVDGSFEITQGNSTSKFTLTKADKEQTQTLYENSGGDTYDFTAVWRLPYDMLGKTLELYWEVELDYTSGEVFSEWKLSGLDNVTISVPAAQAIMSPQVTMATMSFSKAGMLEIPWLMTSDAITAARYEYVDFNGRTVKKDLATNSNSGVIYLSAIEPHKNFRVVVSYKDNQGNPISNIGSDPQDLPVIHGPHGLTVRPLGGPKQKMEISWNAGFLDASDLAITDFFEIQRSLTGEEDDFEDIGKMLFSEEDLKKGVYTFIDSTVVESISEGHLRNGNTLDRLTYRVRRAMTSSWGWDQQNTCASTARSIVDGLHLLRISNYSAEWEDTLAHTARVKWDYANDQGGVWDERAQMVLRVIATNRDSAQVENTIYVLNQAERDQRYKVVNLSRSCVHFDIEVYVDRHESPFSVIQSIDDGDEYFPIYTYDDWVAFRDKVEAAKGASDVNARLYADIDAKNITIGWSADIAYRGTFDGNGHTITLNISDYGDNIALFRNAKDYTIKNLHVTGSVKGGIHSAGLVGVSRGGEHNVIENCHVSVAVDCSGSHAGGFVGHGITAGHIITNCLFDGSIKCSGSNTRAGAFIGWCDNHTKNVISNCLEKGSYTIDDIGLNNAYDGGVYGNDTKNKNNWSFHSWAEANAVGTLSMGELAVKLGSGWQVQGGTVVPRMQTIAGKPIDYFFAIRTADDWTTFINKVKSADGQDVNARLYADITIPEASMSAWAEDKPFCGTFDGNGHTLNVQLSSATSLKHTAPFRYVASATIRNLHTTGTVNTSQQFAAGLIGKVVKLSTSSTLVVIEGCRSSVTVSSTLDYNNANGGFIGEIANNCNVIMRNCKFDGAFEGESADHIGGFVGWVNSGSNLSIDNSIFAPDHISVEPDACEIWARLTNGATLTLINSYATRDFSPFIAIGNSRDWSLFVGMVKQAKNKYDVNAVLLADISLNSKNDIVGYSENYRGTFNGNGHTLTLNISDNAICTALFAHVGNATFRNLHLAGTVSSSEKLHGSLIGSVDGGYSVTIESCQSSVTLKSSVNGDATMGGFIGIVNINSDVTFRNCKFDGSFDGVNTHSNGGFVGWSTGSVTIENCLFMPSSVNTDPKESETWVRNSANISFSATNSYATNEFCYVINNSSDWDDFRNALGSRDTKSVNAIMNADVTISSSAYNFKGTFDGNGHTMTTNINGSAMFGSATGYTIRNLHVNGSVSGDRHISGLVVSASGSDRAYIENCWVSTNVHCNEYYAGGFIGHAGNTPHTITNCLFDGAISGRNDGKLEGDAYVGAIIGWGGAADYRVTNCLEDGNYYYFNNYGFCYTDYECWGNDKFSSSNNFTYKDWGEVNYGGIRHSNVSDWIGRLGDGWYQSGDKALPKMTTRTLWNNVGTLSASELVEKLGSANWVVVAGKAVPIQHTSSVPVDALADKGVVDSLNVALINGWTKENDVLVPSTTQTEEVTLKPFSKPVLPDFYHANYGKIEPVLLTTVRQSSVLLAWNTDGNPIDYFTVMRRILGEGDDKWKEIATNLDQLSYEDTTVSPLATYEYKVIAVNDCEGLSTSETDPKVGECKHTGRVEGYVRFNDGTGVPDVQVDAIYSGKTVKFTKTDESGHYVIDELSYYGKNDASYTISAVATDDISFDNNVNSYDVTFNANSNDETIHEIIITSGKRFSGFVMYEGTSIPVKGVNFLVNGKKIHNAKGKFVETDYDGSFSFRVMQGDNTIQAVMDKHKFTNDGWYKNSDKQNITDDVAGIYFYDATKVKLTGRVVGGNDQGRLPLGSNLSRNNLGDSLTMVLTLEGDNTSWLVYDNLNPNNTQRDTVFQHPLHALHPKRVKPYQTEVQTYRKRMVVRPDVRTGEYMLKLPPVRWKVQQVYCKGYPTLFQEGQVSEVIDLTNCLDEKDTTYVGTYKDIDTLTVYRPKLSYNAIYNRIYHNPVEVTYKQVGYDNFDYFGDKSYMATNLGGERREVPLAYQHPLDSTKAVYTFDFPVFSIDRKYYIKLQVGETYTYNNDPSDGKIDLVKVGGGMAFMQNGMKAGAEKESQPLDSLGQTVFAVQADQVAKLLFSTNALKTITFSVRQDSTYYEAPPLHGYVLNMFPLGEGKSVLNEGQPVLFDILRDPPGSYSTNTLAKGATINYTYTMNFSLSSGMVFSATVGQQKETYFGTVAAPQGNGSTAGYLTLSDNSSVTLQDLVFNMQGSKAFSYTMNIGHNISTSGDPSLVGADGDLYIGQVQNVQVTPMSTIRALTDSMYNEIHSRVGLLGSGAKGPLAKYLQYGSLEKIAEGKNAKGETFHLVRDVSLGYGPKMQSHFIYSQKQLLTQIIPEKAKEILALLYSGTEEDAQALADKKGKPVYLSLRETSDPKYGMMNGKVGDYYNTDIKTANDTINYLVVLPKGKTSTDFNDEVAEKSRIIYAWVKMITQNEHEKLYAYDHVVNYDIAGAQGVNYSETFDSNYTNTEAMYFPFGKQPDYFSTTGANGTWQEAVSFAAQFLTALVGYAESFASADSKPSKPGDPWIVDKNGQKTTSIKFGGLVFKWAFVPVLSMCTIGADTKVKAYNRTESFTIATDPTSRLNVDVYRVGRADTTTVQKNQRLDPTDVFTNYDYKSLSDQVLAQMKGRVSDIGYAPRSFVFRTRGGATANPWENERKTLFYQPGTVLDERTQKIINPKIRLDKQSISGVPISDAARFQVFVSNQSEKPEATGGLSVLQVFSGDQANPNGAKISINGQPLTTAGLTVSVIPGLETALTMEVRAGNGFDYEGLKLGVLSPTDPDHTTELVAFDVHFLREAGPVNIQTPGDKWVLNTMAQQDSKRGWYLPVIINGFDRHQHNFDHIEFQYKESQRGDDAWTNLCSFYADSTLMAGANGVCKLIPENGNIVTEFYGEGWVMERTYDLRAVLCCRNGNDFLTTPSKVISGIKDTRRPQIFGSPEPKSGLLTASDDIIFNFSEDIEHNYLSAITNFEVKGEVNNNSLSEMVSVQFSGKGSVESEAKRNFSGKDLTIDMRIKPDETGRDMPLFSHGTNGQKLQLWLTKDFKLKAVVNGQAFTSDSVIGKNAFRHVAMVLNQTDSLLTLFNGGVEIGHGKLNALYNSTGTLIFGRTNEPDRSQSQYYEGRMMEARLWYSAMDGSLIGSTYGGRRLTGFEKDLVDYYPMNEGSGKYVTDRTQGANAQLIDDIGWAIPRGLSLSLKKADKGVRLNKNAMNRNAEHDYTIMFWFRTDAEGRGTLLSNGRGLKEDNGAANQFRIGFDDSKLTYRTNGFEAEVPGDWSDGDWHNFAMTVNRSRNVANIYMDKTLVTTFEADSLGGISGGYPLIGATRYDVVKDNGDVETLDGDDALTGNIDELMFFAQALPEQLISTYATKSPNGDEIGLLTYLGFDRIERQKDNDLEMVPYAYSKKIYLDDKGQPRYQLDPLTKEPTSTLVRDYLFADSMDVVMQHFDKGYAAPVVPYEEVKNLKFSFIGKDNQLLVELDEPAAKLNHRNIYVTVRDVEDLNGNTMASPQTACFYVNNSSLEWLLNSFDHITKYGEGEELELPFYNYSATSHTYTIENCPRWLTLNNYSGMIAPLGSGYITATVSKDLNVGTYNEIIYLTDEDGITEPFYLNLTVEGEQPDWAENISGDLLQNSMNIVGQVYLNGELDTDTRDIVGVFDDNNVCHGFANISHSAETGETGLYLTVYDNKTIGEKLNFVLWHYNTGREMLLTTKDTIRFINLAMLGSDTPVRFEGGDSYVQRFQLKKGWNWVSLNVHSEELEKVDTLLYNMTWKEGDMITDMSSDVTLLYKDSQWELSGDMSQVNLSPKKSYAIYVNEAMKLSVSGSIIKDEDARTIELENGWNGIGYTPMTNLSVETALSDYYDQAQTGDVIKSQSEFAYFTKAGNTGRWRGSLQYMKPGEGYLLLHKALKPAEFRYPFYEPGSAFLYSTAASRTAGDGQLPSPTPNPSPKGRGACAAEASPSGGGWWRPTASSHVSTLTTMSVSAVVEGFELQEGDSLTALTNGEVVGKAAVSTTVTTDGTVVLNGSGAEESEPLYLTVGGNKQLPVRFAIERDGNLVAYTPETMNYRANAIVGTPDEPQVLSFVEGSPTGISSLTADQQEGQWYTTSGVKLQKAPTRPGLYIYNGKKLTIK